MPAFLRSDYFREKKNKFKSKIENQNKYFESSTKKQKKKKGNICSINSRFGKNIIVGMNITWTAAAAASSSSSASITINTQPFNPSNFNVATYSVVCFTGNCCCNQFKYSHMKKKCIHI